ncbi:flagellin [Gammaproteobacteria bacterium]|nr:flagellin [Gammaproteobacteria bacterium]
MTTINTNVSSLIAKNAIGQNERAMSQAMTRLSTGSRINSARDDAAGLAISERMSSQISGLNMAVRNANDGISFLQTVEGATKEISSMLGRMRELAVQAASGTYTTTDQAALDLEFGALMTEIGRVATDTEFNGEAVLKGALTDGDGSANDPALSKNIQIGTDAAQTMALSINTWRPSAAVDLDQAAGAGNLVDSNDVAGAYGTAALFGKGGGGTILDTAVSTDRILITSTTAASEAITQLDKAITGAGAERAKYGAYMSRLQHAADNLANVATNTAASRSQIADADYASETTELARTQIISQASTAMLAQANQVKQTVLALLR